MKPRRHRPAIATAQATFAPEDLQQSEPRWRRIVETTQEGIWIADLTGVTTFVNPQMSRMLATTPERMLGQPVYDYVFPEDHVLVRQHFVEYLEHTEGKRVQERLRKRDGAELWTLVAASVLPDAFGRPVGFLGMFTDITERVRAEEALREAQRTLEQRVSERTAELQTSNLALAANEEKYRRLFETISDAAFMFDAETRQFLEVNEAALRLYGYTREEFLRLTARQITAEPEDTEAAIQLALAGAAPRIPLRHHVKNGGVVFPVEISASTFVLKDRAVVCGVVRDITARKQAEEALRRREQELADFFAEAPLGLLWVGSDGHILRVNQAGLDLLGCAGEQVFGKHVSDICADRAASSEVLGRLAENQTVHGYRTRLRHEDGTLREVLIDANGMWDQGRLVHSRWFMRDITRRVELEREILAISEREQRRLGHDLHDDLCQQLAGMEFLTRRLASDLAARAVSGARQAEEIARMLQRAMAQTRGLAHGLSPVGMEGLGLADALRELAASTSRLYGCDCRFQRKTPAPSCALTLAIHLYRIAQEAVTNAHKHGKAGRIIIGLAAEGQGLSLSVNDNGVGVPRQPPLNTGMGLKIMRYRAEVIGGTLKVEPRRGGGTQVICTVTDEPFQSRNRSTG